MEKRLSQRQFFVMLLVALLSPLVRTIPRQTAELAGNTAWVAPLIAMPFLMLLAVLLDHCFRRLPEGGGLAELFMVSFGDKIGRAICLLYVPWMVLIVCGALRFYCERFVSAIYLNTSMEVFALAMVGFLLWQRHKKLEALARLAQIFFFIIVATITVVLLLSIGNVRSIHLLPLYPQSWGTLGLSGGFVLLLMSYGVGGCFLYSKVERRSGLGAATGWIAGLCLIVTLLGLVVLGVFGTEITKQLQVPFFTLAKEVKIEGAVERMESVVAAMWVFTDIVLIAILLRSCCATLEVALRLRDSNRVEGPLLFLVYGGCWVVASSAFQLENLYMKYVFLAQGVFFVLLPVAACIVGMVRKRL